MPLTTTNSGLHEFVGERVLVRYARPGVRAADLGAGPGAMAARLRSFGCDVLAVDRDANGFEARLPHLSVDFNEQDFASRVGQGAFDLITAIEVIEHVENPIGFLRNIGKLLAPGGVAVLTTPNVDSLPARMKFLVAGKIRTMDEHGEPTHISPIFFDLLERQFLPGRREASGTSGLPPERISAHPQTIGMDASHRLDGFFERIYLGRQSPPSHRSCTLKRFSLNLSRCDSQAAVQRFFRRRKGPSKYFLERNAAVEASPAAQMNRNDSSVIFPKAGCADGQSLDMISSYPAKNSQWIK